MCIYNSSYLKTIGLEVPMVIKLITGNGKAYTSTGKAKAKREIDGIH